MIVSFTLSGCSSAKAIDLNVYLKPTITAQVYSEGVGKNLTIADISSKSPIQKDNYISHEIKLNKEWIYGMYIESISYYICSDNDVVDVEFDFTLTGTENGDTTLINSTKTFNQLKQPYTLKANQGFKVCVEIQDKITLYATDSVLTIKLSDTYTNPNFNYCIYGLEIIGYHK